MPQTEGSFCLFEESTPSFDACWACFSTCLGNSVAWLAACSSAQMAKQDSQRGKGHQQQWWNPTSAKRRWEPAQTYFSDIQPMDSQPVELLQALTKLSLRHGRATPSTPRSGLHGLLRCGSPRLPRDDEGGGGGMAHAVQPEESEGGSTAHHVLGGHPGAQNFVCMQPFQTR